MSLYHKNRVNKHCFVACPPEQCDCIAGDPDIMPAGDFNYDIQYPCDVEPPHEEIVNDKPTTDKTSTKDR